MIEIMEKFQRLINSVITGDKKEKIEKAKEKKLSKKLFGRN